MDCADTYESNSIANTVLSDELSALRLACAIESYVYNIRLHHGLAMASSQAIAGRLDSALTQLSQECAITTMAANGAAGLAAIVSTAADLAKASLMAVAQACMGAVCDSNTLEGCLETVVACLPPWADQAALASPIQTLQACIDATANELTLEVVQHALTAVQEGCDVCGAVVAAVHSADTWGPSQATPKPLPARSPTSTRPPQNSATAARVKANSCSFGQGFASVPRRCATLLSCAYQDCVRAAFSSDESESEWQLLPDVLKTALTDSSTSLAPGPATSDDCAVGCEDKKYFTPESADGVATSWGKDGGEAGKYGTRKLQWQERPIGFRVVMCRHMGSKGVCKKAATCAFAHTQEELEHFRALFVPTERCNYASKCLNRNKDCMYSHTPRAQRRAIRIYNAAVEKATAVADPPADTQDGHGPINFFSPVSVLASA